MYCPQYPRDALIASLNSSSMASQPGQPLSGDKGGLQVNIKQGDEKRRGMSQFVTNGLHTLPLSGSLIRLTEKEATH